MGTAQLLQLLVRLTALQELELAYLHGDWPQQLSAQSGLTASSNLRQLTITNHRCSSSGAEGVSWSHVFPAGRRLPHLRVLKACADD